MSVVKVCNFLIKYSFFALFLLVPWVFTGNTAELFEFNKMWLTFAVIIVITSAWIIKMLARKRFVIQKTPLDLPILLFLLSQIISTLFSLDSYISLWGYYTRWNGGLLSTIAYILLYYALVSNITEFNPKKTVKQIVGVSIVSALFVALWGLPSHFGHDPTCLMFRGNFDVSCWTADFQPMVRMFSTLGQPDWLSAYLDIILPVVIVLFLWKFQDLKNSKSKIFAVCYFLFAVLFYTELNFTGSKSGYLGFIAAFAAFLGYFIWKAKFKKTKLLGVYAVTFAIIIISLFTTNPFPQLQNYSIPNLINKLHKTQPETSPKPSSNKQTIPTQPTTVAPISGGEFGGSDSGKIRSFVWKGALDIARHYPIFGSGVETFAFAYYQYKPQGHNLTSEWDFLYNKAHNEYLNFLATTGIFGLGTYLWMIGLFLWICAKMVWKWKAEDGKWQLDQLLTIGFLISYGTILLTDFGGFSVVITNLYLFLIPAFVFVLNEQLQQSKILAYPAISDSHIPGKFEYTKLSKFGLVTALIVALLGVNMIYSLYNYWEADKHYYLGENYDKISQFVVAYKELHEAVKLRPNEPVFLDELSYNDAIIAVQLASQKLNSDAAKVVTESTDISTKLTSEYPNNILFWKTRVRIFYTLAQGDAHYLSFALEAMQKAQSLAPTDSKIAYNLAILYAQSGDIQKGIDTAKQAVDLKPDYKEPRYTLAQLYHLGAVDQKGKVINPEKEQLAVAQLHYILQNISPGDPQTVKTLKDWGEE